MARRAKATATLLAQVDMAAPLRSKSSDGWIGDAAHQASKSDHNQNAAGVVQAQDITHDPHGGFDSYLFAEHLRTHPDPRVKYVISNRKIFAGDDGPQPWAWRSYGGKNPHDLHVHVSVEDELYDDPRPWDIGFTVGIPDPAAPTISLPTLRVGAEGFYVELLQTLLGKTGAAVDGDFGPVTRDSLTQFQRDHKLDDDGICGPYTWRELLRPWAKEVGLLPRDPKAKLVEMAAVAQKTGSTASVDELITAYLAILEDILPPGYLLKEQPAPPAPSPDEDQYHAVVSGGYFSSDPYDKSSPTAIRTNNPGALNTTAHVASLPGYNTADETSTGNKTAIFWAPEYGVLAYHDLLKRYRDAGATTIHEIIKRYGGGQDYSKYEDFVVKMTGLPASYVIKIDGSTTAT